MVGKNIKMRQPTPTYHKYTRIRSKSSSDTMYPTSSTSSGGTGLPLRSSAPDPTQPQLEQSPRLSDVPCYTCRRRHVKCDRILPHCAKCAKKGVVCLGYRKPLRWAEGVAVRGKLKGKTQPIVDSEALRESRHLLDERRTAVRVEAAQSSFSSLDSISSDMNADAGILELIRYYNTVMCADTVGVRQHPIVVPALATITPQVAQSLPRDILNAILSIAAVHMSVRNPGNRSIGRLTLEMKSRFFEGMNNAVQQPQQQRADVLFICIALLSAMEILEYGPADRWSTHRSGALKLIALHGGIDRFASYYPHLKLVLAGITQTQVVLTLLSPTSFECLDLVKRHDLKPLCFEPKIREEYLAPCPLRLLNSIYDMASCTRNMLMGYGAPSAADAYTREWILSDVLHFQPEEGVEDIKRISSSNRTMSTNELQTWNLIFSAWRNATAVVVLRNLYFGLPDAEIISTISRSPTPTPNAQGTARTFSPNLFEESSHRLGDTSIEQYAEESADDYFNLEHLAPEAYTGDPYSRTPSPMPAQRPPDQSITFDHWNRRYEIHNDAVFELFNIYSALLKLEDATYLRYAMLPLLVFSLVSRPGSIERALAIETFEFFKHSMASQRAPSNPIGGAMLELDIAWDRLDAYSAEIERQQRESTVWIETGLLNSAPEWNWRYMLEQMNLMSAWPTISGAMNLELGTEYWAFNVLATACTESMFAAYMRPPSSSPEASSST